MARDDRLYIEVNYDEMTPLEKKIFDDWNRYGERTMATPLKEGGPVPPGVGDAPHEPVHPGFYTGDDAVEWAKNKIALLQHVNHQLRGQKNPSADPLMDANEREARMLQKLLEARAS